MDITDLQDHNYVPYSQQPSLAVVRSSDGSYFPGCRIENISYPLSISAIQNAICCCLSEGKRPAEILLQTMDDPMRPFWEKEFGISATDLTQADSSRIQFPDIRLPETAEPEKMLVELLDRAVVEESQFPVSAIVESEQGLFSGVNIEFTAWEMGLCAERVAIAKALTYGSKKIRTLHLHTRNGEFSSPCGACRQVIFEHMPNKQVHLHHADHSESVHYSHDLLPHSFRSTSLSNR